MIYVRRHIGTILIAFTTWTAGITIATYRERIATECAYHEGTNEGYRNGFAEGKRDRAPLGCVRIRKLGDGVEEIVPSECEPTARIEETDPEWDCATMGNRKCGPTATPPDTADHTTHRVTKTARK